MSRYRGTQRLCDWNPVLHKPALYPVPREHDCPNEATIKLGYDGIWHVCDSCAKDRKFKRYKVRVSIARAA